MSLKDTRKAAHLTQIELAESSGVTQSAISAIETNRTKAALHDTLVKLAGALSKRLGREVATSEIAPRRAPFLIGKKKR